MFKYLAVTPLLLLTACGAGSAATAPVAATAAATTAASPPATVSPAPTGSPADSAAPLSPPAAAPSFSSAGLQYAYFRSSDPAAREITIDLVEWFEGRAAAKACAADGEKPGENDRCVGYYVRNKDTTPGTVKVAGDAKIQMVVDGKPKRVALESIDSELLFKLTIKNGQVVVMEHIYLP